MRYRSSLAMLAACAVFAAPIAFAAGRSGSSAPPSQSSYDPTIDYKKGADAFASGKYDEAAKAFKKVVSAVPKNPQANYLLGASYMAQGEFSRAVKPLEAAVRYDEKMVDARRDLGITQAKLGKADKADAQLGALKAMQEAVAAQARAHGLPDGLLCARRHLETLLDGRDWPDALSGWRRELLEPVLAPLLPRPR